MDTLLLVGVVVLIVGILCVKLAAKPDVRDNNGPWPFYSRKILSQPEQVLYFRLCSALSNQYIVLAQVGLSRILGVKKGNDFHTWNNRINRMTVDFVICNKDASVIAAIELDDASHQKQQRRIADAKKDKALSSANIKVIRWPVNAIPNEADIRAEFARSLPEETIPFKLEER